MSSYRSVLHSRRARSAADERGGDDRWLISYADFMTLLFAFFVVMYAISSVNDEKYRVLGATLEAVFSVPLSRVPKNSGATEADTGFHDGGVEVIDLMSENNEPEAGDTYHATDPSAVQENLQGFIEERLIAVAGNEDWLEISLNGSTAFESGSARLSAEAEAAVQSVARFLTGLAAPVTVEGYADSLTDETEPRLNWSLSGARAASVAALLERSGVQRDRLSAVGYSENHPLRTNATPAGRAANRRAVIVLSRKGNVARNLNATAFQSTPFGSSKAFVRQLDETPRVAAPEPIRTPEGGLLFTSPQEGS
ncbi:MAG: OmpA family protein [Pseudomonadota bacterium]